MAWTWRFEQADGGEAELPQELKPEEFTTQGDAESWIGEIWKGLLEAGVERVRLSDDAGVEVYAMSLREAVDA
ncbi:hypothetical protein [Streptomyces sp. NPDC097619]|uniref:hypothetical protein n=1 Tax=Streptomyces sp. NPDC097619 TaxID=3157228 RepID=UPI00332C3DA9